MTLRLVEYGHPTGFFRRVRIGSEVFLRENDGFALRFFPPELARSPTSFRFAARKPDGVRRIFVFGESAAMGDPQPAYGASRYLEVLLRASRGDRPNSDSLGSLWSGVGAGENGAAFVFSFRSLGESLLAVDRREHAMEIGGLRGKLNRFF